MRIIMALLLMTAVLVGSYCAVVSRPPERRYGIVLKFENRETGAAYAGMGYKVLLDDGAMFSGQTDAEGRTRQILSNHPAYIIKVETEPGFMDDSGTGAWVRVPVARPMLPLVLDAATAQELPQTGPSRPPQVSPAPPEGP